MTQAEFSRWVEFYRLFPFDDAHRYHRPAAAVAAAIGGDYRKFFDFLSPEPVPEGFSAADMATLKAFGMKPPPRV